MKAQVFEKYLVSHYRSLCMFKFSTLQHEGVGEELLVEKERLTTILIVFTCHTSQGFLGEER